MLRACPARPLGHRPAFGPAAPLCGPLPPRLGPGRALRGQGALDTQGVRVLQRGARLALSQEAPRHSSVTGPHCVLCKVPLAGTRASVPLCTSFSTALPSQEQMPPVREKDLLPPPPHPGHATALASGRGERPALGTRGTVEACRRRCGLGSRPSSSPLHLLSLLNK